MDKIKITYIAHASILIESEIGSIITDPMFSERISFIKLKHEQKYNPKNLPDLSAVLISHTHLDHFDHPSFNYISTTVPIIVPENTQKTISKHLPNPVIELSEWAEHSFPNGIKVYSIPVTHPNYRCVPLSQNKSAGYLIEIQGKKILFVGDTTYNSYFKDIGHAHNIDLAILPIGSYSPAFIMKRFHMDPAEAVQAMIDLNAKKMIPIHWGSFRLSLEKMDAPIKWLEKAAKDRGISEKITIVEHGDNISV